MSPWQAKTLPTTPNSFLYCDSDGISMHATTITLQLTSTIRKHQWTTLRQRYQRPGNPKAPSRSQTHTRTLTGSFRNLVSIFVPGPLPTTTSTSTTTTRYRGPSVATSSAIHLSHKSIPTWATSNATPNTPHLTHLAPKTSPARPICLLLDLDSRPSASPRGPPPDTYHVSDTVPEIPRLASSLLAHFTQLTQPAVHVTACITLD